MAEERTFTDRIREIRALESRLEKEAGVSEEEDSEEEGEEEIGPGGRRRRSDRKVRGPKRERFVRLANLRVGNALNALRVLGNLANRNNYEYESADVEKIFGRLERKLAEVHAAFEGKEEAEDTFSLEEE